MKIYLAGPLFTTAEREFNTKLAGLLRERARALAATKHRTAQEHNPHIFRKDFEGGSIFPASHSFIRKAD